MRVKLRHMLVIGAVLASFLVDDTLGEDETLNGADSSTVTIIDPRKYTRATSNINAAAINSLTGSSPSSSSVDGNSNDTQLIFATHVTTERAPQLENHEGLTNQLGQPVYLQAQPQPHQQGQLHSQQVPQPSSGQFLYPQPAPVQSNSNLGGHHQQAALNAPGASPPYLLHPGYGVQYVQYVPRPIVMPNYPPPPSVYGHNPAHYSNLPLYPPGSGPHHNYHAHGQGIPPSAQFILPPPPGHHTIPSLNSYSPHQHHHNQHQHQPQQHHQQTVVSQQQQPQSHHPQTHFLVGPSPQTQPAAPSSTYASGSVVGQPQVPSQQHQQLQQHQGQASTQPNSYLTYSSPSHHYHSSQPHVHPVHHHHQQHHGPNPTAQSSNIIPSHVQAPSPQQVVPFQQQQQQQHHSQQQQLIGSYSHQAPLYSYVQSQQLPPRYGDSNGDSFLNTNEYLPVQYDNSQFRAIKRNSKA